MAKDTSYVCTNCNAEYAKWAGKCNACGTWNCLEEKSASHAASAKTAHRYTGYSKKSTLSKLSDVEDENYVREKTHSAELDRVLGGGIVPASVILIGGDPGIGKSTLILQTLGHLATKGKAVYVSGEESKGQIAMRAKRLKVDPDRILMLGESHLESILDMAENENPDILVIDSIQTIYSDSSSSSPGSVTQVKEAAAALSKWAKSNGTTLLIVGHVTKDGEIAGPRVLEHIVDVVLSFSGESNQSIRILRALKNRFGATSEVGILEMVETGLIDVKDPGMVFLTQDRTPVPGSVITVVKEGSRSMLVEIQTLVDQNNQPNPRRLVLGLEGPRIAMLLAVLNKITRMKTYKYDIYVSLIGGFKTDDTSTDVAVFLSILSALNNTIIPNNTTFFGEIDLTGKLRPTANIAEKIMEAQKMGFTRAVVPKFSVPKNPPKGIAVTGVANIYELIGYIGKIAPGIDSTKESDNN